MFPWQEVCKFLAGNFFIYAVGLFYSYFYGAPFTLLNVSRAHSIMNTGLFVLFFYLGFMRKRRDPSIG